MRSAHQQTSTPAKPLLPSGSSRLHYLYWALIFLLTIGFGFGPLFVFVREIETLHGQLAATAFWLAPIALGTTAVSLLPAGFYQCRPFERGGRVYELLGVHYFRFLVPHGDGINWLVRRSQPGYRVVRNRQTIADYEVRTIGAEAFHLGCLIVMTPAAAYATVAGWLGMALWLTLPSIPLHIYPVLLQRYTRARMARREATRRGPRKSRSPQP
jgi:hypothetical protein